MTVSNDLPVKTLILTGEIEMCPLYADYVDKVSRDAHWRLILRSGGHGESWQLWRGFLLFDQQLQHA